MSDFDTMTKMSVSLQFKSDAIRALKKDNKTHKKRIAELEAHVEAMKCCGNCKKEHSCWGISFLPECKITATEKIYDNWQPKGGEG